MIAQENQEFITFLTSMYILIAKQKSNVFCYYQKRLYDLINLANYPKNSLFRYLCSNKSIL